MNNLESFKILMAMDIGNLCSKLREAGNKEYIEADWGIGFKLAERT